MQYSLVFIKGSSSRARLCGFSILYEKDEKPYIRLAAWEMNHLIKTAKPAWRLMELHLIRQLRCHLVPYKCSQIGRSYLLHLFFRMIWEAVGLSKAHLGADAFYCHRREVRQPTPCCMRPSKQVVPFIERHTCNKLGWDR